MLIPQWRYDIILSAFTYHSPRSCSLCIYVIILPGWLWFRWCYLKKVYRKKKVSPPSSTEAHPLRHSGWTQISNDKLQINTKYTMYTKETAYLHILSQRKSISPTLGKNLLILRWNLLLDNIKAITGRNPFRVIKPLPLLWSSIVVIKIH